ncbi:MAG: cation transporter [Proteobacteria bacterium]|nr:MAG: cation transporter [Pseudomonadota bacterium]
MDISRKASIISFTASIAILALKFYAYWMTGSTAILSDAMESIINVLAAGVTLMLMKTVVSPADDNHPYGHGKLEYFSAAFEGGLIAFAGVMIGKEAIEALYKGAPLHNIDIGVYFATAAALGNLVLGLYIGRIGKKARSEALIASAQHILSDVWSTAGTLLGLALVWIFDIPAFDAVAALLIAVNLSYSGYKIFRRSTAALIDETDPETLDLLAKTFTKNRRMGVIDIHLTKVIRSGRFHHVDSHLVLPEFWTIDEAHPFAKNFEQDVLEDYEGEGEINFHIDPCHRAFCNVCDMDPCPVRQRLFVDLRPITSASITGHAVHDIES